MKLSSEDLMKCEGQTIIAITQDGCNILRIYFADYSTLELEVELVNATVGLYGIGGKFLSGTKQ